MRSVRIWKCHRPVIVGSGKNFFSCRKKQDGENYTSYYTVEATLDMKSTTESQFIFGLSSARVPAIDRSHSGNADDRSLTVRDNA